MVSQNVVMNLWIKEACHLFVTIPGPPELIPTDFNHSNSFNTLRPRQNGRNFADDTFKRIFLNENVGISIKISLKFVPKGPINNIPALVLVMAWRQPGDKPLTEPMVVRLLMHICVTRPQWVNLIDLLLMVMHMPKVKFNPILTGHGWLNEN